MNKNEKLILKLILNKINSLTLTDKVDMVIKLQDIYETIELLIKNN